MIINSKIFKIFISSLVLVLICFSIDWHTLINIKLNFTLIDIPLLLFLLWSSLFLRIYRWHILINTKSHVINLIGSVQLFFIGQSLNIILPSGAGDVAKGYYGYKFTGIKERMFAISLIDKLIAIGSILFITPLAFYYSNSYSILIAGLLSILPFLFIYYFNFFNNYKLFNIPFKYLSNKIKKIDLELLITHMKMPSSKIVFAFIISIVGWLITYSIFFMCIKISNLDINFHIVLAYIPFLVLGRLFPFTLNGIGSDEALIIFLFSTNDSFNGPILLGALLYRLILMFLPALIGLLFIFKKSNEIKI